MAEPRAFSPDMQRTVADMRAARATWDEIALAVGASRWWVIEHAKAAGLWNKLPGPVAPVVVREDVRGGFPLPACHPIALAVLRDAGLPITEPAGSRRS